MAQQTSQHEGQFEAWYRWSINLFGPCDQSRYWTRHGHSFIDPRPRATASGRI